MTLTTTRSASGSGKDSVPSAAGPRTAVFCSSALRLAANSGDVLAYEKATPTNGGKVLLRNGTVKDMTAAEFQASKKIQPATLSVLAGNSSDSHQSTQIGIRADTPLPPGCEPFESPATDFVFLFIFVQNGGNVGISASGLRDDNAFFVI